MRGELLLRNLARAVQYSPSRICLYRTLSTSPLLFKPSGSKYDSATTSRPPKESCNQEGESARTDSKVSFGYPDGEALSRDPLRGHGSRHFKPTLASFSLEGKVAVLTGAARGLGLVMAQALMLSGADIAIVDLNGEFASAHL
jgi:D-arabinitol 2-dehydrogenase